MPNQRPDEAVLNKDGTIDRTEVRSAGQTKKFLKDKLANARGAMGSRAGIDRVVEPDPPGGPVPSAAEPMTPPDGVPPDFFPIDL